jgi:hypothetical protein
MQHTPALCARGLANRGVAPGSAAASGLLLAAVLGSLLLLLELTAAGQRTSHPLKVLSSEPEYNTLA